MVEHLLLCVSPDSAYHDQVGELVRDKLAVSVLDCETVAEARELIGSRPIDCVITAFELPDGTGLELFEIVRDCAPDTGCICYTETDPSVLRAETSAYLGEYVDKRRSSAETRLLQLIEAATIGQSQTAYPIPPFEDERLATLAQLDLDSPHLDPRLDRLVNLASLHFDVPQASIHIISDHTLDFLACSGAEWESIPRESSICTQTILTDRTMVVEDTFADPRFTENGLIREFGIRFYAGCPLVTDDGLPIGTLCLHDWTPRTFSETDKRILELLAAEVMDWLTLATDDSDHQPTLTS